MRVLGLDISQTSTGVAVLSDGPLVVYHTNLNFDKKKRLGDNLMMFSELIKSIVELHGPFDYIVIEDVFFGKNIKTLKILARYSGAAILACRLHSSSSKLYLLMPATIRSAIFPGTKVDKDDIYKYICTKHKLTNVSNDVTDAIAAATVPFTMKKVDAAWVI